MRGQAQPAASPSWPETVDRFILHLVDQEKSRHTIEAYRGDLSMFAAWYRGEYGTAPDIASLGSLELRTWKTHLSGLKQSVATINRRLAALRSLSKWATAEELAETPAPVPKSIRQEVPPPKWLNKKEQHGLLRALERDRDPRALAVVTFLLHTGLRIEEMAGLTWDRVSWSERKGSVTVMGKGRKQRTIPLNIEARAALGILSDLAGAIPAGNRVIQGQRGPITIKGLQRLIERAGQVARLEGFHAHLLRHTFLKRCAESGLALEQIAALAGHESLDTTRRYIEPGQEELAAAVERLAGEA